jgi:hypothetical protein
MQGHDTTLPVTNADIAYHTRAVKRGSANARIIADMPFGSYQESPAQAFRNAVDADGRPVRRWSSSKAAAKWPRRRASCPARHPGLRPRRPDAAIGASSAATRCRAKRRSRCRASRPTRWHCRRPGATLIVLEAIPAAAGGRSHQRNSSSSPSASAPARNAPARCWSCTTCFRHPARQEGQASSRTSWPDQQFHHDAACRASASQGRQLPRPGTHLRPQA